jgi:hypothetical protein
MTTMKSVSRPASKTRVALAAFALSLALSGCGIVDAANPDEELVLNETVLEGKILRFRNTSSEGGDSGATLQPEIEYVFTIGNLVACNASRTFRATAWEVNEGNNSIRVSFGSQWENWKIVEASGSLEGSNLKGTYEYTSSVSSLKAFGDFTQVSSPKFCK